MMHHASKEMIYSQQGIALLIVLWVMTIIMVTALSFTLLTRAETFGTLTFKDRVAMQLLAEAGIERGIAEILNRSVHARQNITLVDKEVWKTNGTAYYGHLEDGKYQVKIYDETGKISLNGLSDASGIIVKKLLVNLGSSPEEADTIVDSILDWKDADSLHRLYGAEDEYYQSLPRPYKARNAAFASLEELLLVKGITRDILYGSGKREGLIGFLTLFNRTNRINLNAAPREILAALPGLDAVLADQIIGRRETGEIKSIGDVADIIGSANTLLSPYVGVQSDAVLTCTIEAYGYQDLKKSGYSATAIVTMEGPHKYRYVHYRSPAERGSNDQE
jgi:general secretion pathway protein K